MVWHTRFRGEDLYHHIYAWGNDRHPVFKETYHYHRYLSYLEQYADKHKIDIIAYALMTGHIHLFIYDRENNISDFMLHLHGEYAKYYNWSAHRVGHIFGERYNNKIVEANEYGMWLSRYINRQALKAGIVDDPEQYPWTSYRIYIGIEKNIFLKHEIIIKQFGEEKDAYLNYKNFVLADNDGPVNWELIERKCNRKRESIEEICKKMGVDMNTFKHVQGRTQRKNRHELIIRLLKDYGLRAVEIADYFDMTKAAISKIVK
jgi:REP element-mobilizing transposase RayT